MSKKEGTLYRIGWIAAIILFIWVNPWWGFAAVMILFVWLKIAAERPLCRWASVYVHDLSVSVIALHTISDKHGMVGYEAHYRVTNQSGEPLPVSNDLFALYENGVECYDATEIETLSLMPGASCLLEQLFAKRKTGHGRRDGLTLIDRSTGMPVPMLHSTK